MLGMKSLIQSDVADNSAMMERGAAAEAANNAIKKANPDRYPEAYSKGSQRLQWEARQSPLAQAYKRGQNSWMHNNVQRAANLPSSNMKMRGYTVNPWQPMHYNIGVMGLWQTPSGQRVSAQNQTQPNLNLPSPSNPVPVAMPWNR